MYICAWVYAPTAHDLLSLDTHGAGVSVFGTHELLNSPALRGTTPPGFPFGGYGGGGPKMDGVHYRIAASCGISGKLRRKYSPGRPPTPIRRMEEMEAKRRAQAVARGLGPRILVVDHDRDSIVLETGSGKPSRPATRGSRRAADVLSRASSTEQHVRIDDGHATELDMSMDLGTTSCRRPSMTTDPRYKISKVRSLLN